MKWLLFFSLMMTAFGPTMLSAKPTGDALAHFRDCEDCSEMVILPGGKYLMGAAKEEFEGFNQYRYMYMDETPQHTVDVKSFAIAMFAVTRAQFGIFADETGFSGEGCTIFNGKKWAFDSSASWRNPGFKQSNRDPVVCVSWNDARKFIAWINNKNMKESGRHYRLPTEEEWEYAARAGTGTSSYWGGNPQDQCKYENARDLTAKKLDPNLPVANCIDGYVTTAPVGSFRSNPWGLFDMLGNANQWVSDCPALGYSNGSIEVNREAVRMFGCSSRLLRGASWATIPIGVRAASRFGGTPDTRNSTNGFRLAIDLPN